MQGADPKKMVKSGLLRYLLIGVGWGSIALGIVGLFLPLVPSVPFLLLAVFCFSRSSERFHNWLVEHKHFGPMLKDYLLHGSIPLRAKWLAISAIWISFPVTSFVFVDRTWLRVLLLTVAGCVSLYLLVIPSAPRSRSDADPPPPVL